MSSRLGGGEFQYPQGFNATRQERGLLEDGPTKERLDKEVRFLRAVLYLEPGALASLERISAFLPKSIGDNGEPPIPEEELTAWCKHLNLTAPWCRQIAKELILRRWFELQPGGEEFSWEALGNRAAREEKAAQPFHDLLNIDCGFWAVTQQTRKEFEAQRGSVPKQVLKMYCDRMEQQAFAAGMERTLEKREFDHFYWLARRVVHGESAACMKDFTAAFDNVSVRAINKAVNELARDLELTLGRPRQNIIRRSAVRRVHHAGARRTG